MPADEIQQREKENPDNIDKVPIESKIVDGRGMPVHVGSVIRLVEQNEQNADADDHVQGVHAGHGKVQEKEQLRMLRHIRSQGDIPLISGMDKVLNAEARSGDMVLDIFV